LVDAKPPGARAFADAPDNKKAVQDYLERVAKYVPAEIIAAYLTGLPVVTATTTEDTTGRTVLYGVLLLGCVIFTPLYIKFMAEDNQPRRTQQWIGIAAMLIWAYSIGGFFTDIGWYHAGVAALTIIFFSLGTGLAIPTTGTK